jgi:hypothetical protein
VGSGHVDVCEADNTATIAEPDESGEYPDWLDDTYVEQAASVINVDQWLRWLALQTMLSNKGSTSQKNFAAARLQYMLSVQGQCRNSG